MLMCEGLCTFADDGAVVESNKYGVLSTYEISLIIIHNDLIADFWMYHIRP